MSKSFVLLTEFGDNDRVRDAGLPEKYSSVRCTTTNTSTWYDNTLFCIIAQNRIGSLLHVAKTEYMYKNKQEFKKKTLEEESWKNITT